MGAVEEVQTVMVLLNYLKEVEVVEEEELVWNHYS